jgi:plastocyanin
MPAPNRPEPILGTPVAPAAAARGAALPAPWLALGTSLLALALLCAAPALAAGKPARVPPPEWLGSDLPLPLPVHTQQDAEFKKAAEKQYLIFNLLAAGKLAWDAGDYASAAQKWEALAAVKGLDAEVEAVVRPFLAEAKRRAAAAPAANAAPPVVALPEPPKERPAPEKRAAVTVEGAVSGGGQAGPGGAVVILRRADGRTPRPSPVRREVAQENKTFLPHVLPVPVGSTVVFKNADNLVHDVFSLSPAADRFNTGLYRKDEVREQTFEKPGVIELLCDIHAQMQAYVLVIDSPWFAQADAAGAFKIAGVPPGDYEVEAWHEFASRPTRQQLTVGRDGARLSLTVAGDKRPNAFPPDKQGKPRQTQVGY